MATKIDNTDYNNFKEIPYLSGIWADISSTYCDDVDEMEDEVTDDNKYLKSDDFQQSLKMYYENEDSDDLEYLKKYIASAYVENEKLTQSELRNKLNYAIKTENLYRNVKNNELYNSALQKMVKEDIDLDNKEIERITNSLEDKNRNLEIRQYYDDKMNYQIEIVKIVIIICLILLGISFLYKINLLNTKIYIVLIGVGLACIVIFTIGKLIDILMRDNYKFDEYSYIRSHHYLNKGDDYYKKNTDNEIPLYQQKDLISNKCLGIFEGEEKRDQILETQ